ncbi:DUF892 family protein [Gillisia limnaea]|nr:DUF892 family protein [Gillisia limnaea]
MHSAEDQITETLPELINAAEDSKLKKALESHLE